MQAELEGGRLDADAHISDAARDTQRHSDMGVLDVLLVADHGVGGDGMLLHQMVNQQSRSGPGLAIYETKLKMRDVGESTHLRC